MGCKNACMGARSGEQHSLDTNGKEEIIKQTEKQAVHAEGNDTDLHTNQIDLKVDLELISNPVPIQSAVRGYLLRKELAPGLEKYRSEKFFDVEGHYEHISDFEGHQDSELVKVENNLPDLELCKPLNDESVQLKSPLRLDDGGIYSGEWNREGKIHGIGTLLSPTGAKLTGYFRDNKLNGVGRQIEPSGLAYQGEFKNGNYEGEGKFFRKNGALFEGNFKEGTADGDGTETWPDGVKFTGSYKNGLRHGQGELQMEDGVYKGTFRKNQIHGTGCFKWNNGNFYEGMWKKNCMHGYGKFVWSNGRKYEGEWRNDQRNGKGTMTWPDGKKFSGLWKDGQQHGQGVISFVNKKGVNTETAGVWEFGTRVSLVSG